MIAENTIRRGALNWDRLTKLIVLASTVAAFGLLVSMNSQADAVLLPATVGAFAVACLLEAVAGDLVLSGVLLLLYLVPAIFLLTLGVRYRYSYASPWLAALLGCLIVRSVRGGWALPRPFRAPLVLWALSVSLVWPILAARELDFTMALLYGFNVGASRAGIPPSIAIEWMLYVVCTSLIGFLFLDALFAAYPWENPRENAAESLRRFEARVAAPLFVGALVSALVATYQSRGHMDFLNPTIYNFFGRATGTMLDGNVFGSIAALWLLIAAAGLFEAVSGRRPIALAWAAAMGVLAAALFATGSRTGLLIAIAAAPLLAIYAWRRLRGYGLVTVVSAAAFLVLIAVIGLRGSSSPTSGLHRLRYALGDGSADSLRFTITELWRRNGYGTAATQAILDHPLVGIGTGNFNTQAPDWMFRRTGFLIFVPDNAQNWYRHQFAELGLLGSLGWIAWTLLVARALVRHRNDGPMRVAAVKGGVVGVACASLLGMPAQDSAVWLTFVVFAFWCLRLVQPGPVDEPVRGWAGNEPREWIVVAAIAVLFTSGTAYAAWHEMRPPLRALAADWTYQYGFFEPEEPDKHVRWTGKKAVEVMPAPKRWLKLVIGGGPPASARAPIEVQVSRNGQPILHLSSTEASQSTTYVRVPDQHRLVEGDHQVMIEIIANRTWTPHDFGRPDRRDLGVRVDNWSFVDEPPPGATTIE